MSKKRRFKGKNNGKGKRAKGASGNQIGGKNEPKAPSAAHAVQVGEAINAVLLERSESYSTKKTSTPGAYGAALLKALIRGTVISTSGRNDMSADRFFKGFWGQKSVAIRPSRTIHEHLACSKDDVREWLRTQKLIYGRDLDVTNYVDGERKTYNEEGDATAEKILDVSVEKEGNRSEYFGRSSTLDHAGGCSQLWRAILEEAEAPTCILRQAQTKDSRDTTMTSRRYSCKSKAVRRGRCTSSTLEMTPRRHRSFLATQDSRAATLRLSSSNIWMWHFKSPSSLVMCSTFPGALFTTLVPPMTKTTPFTSHFVWTARNVRRFALRSYSNGDPAHRRVSARERRKSP